MEDSNLRRHRANVLEMEGSEWIIPRLKLQLELALEVKQSNLDHLIFGNK